jgi:hypothetical protein
MRVIHKAVSTAKITDSNIAATNSSKPSRRSIANETPVRSSNTNPVNGTDA